MVVGGSDGRRGVEMTTVDDDDDTALKNLCPGLYLTSCTLICCSLRIPSFTLLLYTNFRISGRQGCSLDWVLSFFFFFFFFCLFGRPGGEMGRRICVCVGVYVCVNAVMRIDTTDDEGQHSTFL